MSFRDKFTRILDEKVYQMLLEAAWGCQRLPEAVRDHQYAVVDFSEHEAPNFLVASA